MLFIRIGDSEKRSHLPQATLWYCRAGGNTRQCDSATLILESETLFLGWRARRGSPGFQELLMRPALVSVA